MVILQFIKNRQIYDKTIIDKVPEANQFLWLSTANIKNMYVEKYSRFVPFLEIISDLIKDNVNVRLIHAQEPGPNFKEEFDKYPALINGLERMLCKRIHFKTVIIDGEFIYLGSANLTGAGMGAKNKDRRNFENGIITTKKAIIDQVIDQFDKIWMGKKCENCDRKEYCSEYKDIYLEN